MPTPIGAPDIAFGGALVALGAAALLLMGNGFDAGRTPRRRDGFGLPDAPSARRARDKQGKPTRDDDDQS